MLLPINFLCSAMISLHLPDYNNILNQASKSNKILFTALVLAILSSVMVVYLLKEKYRKEKFLATYLAETRIARKLHDEIANELYGTMLLVNNTEVVSGSKKEQLLEQLDVIYKTTRDISRQNNEIDTGPHYVMQLRQMLKMYSTDSVKVLVKGVDDISWEKLKHIQKIITFRVLQEMMVNMKKHSQASLVLIDIKNEKGRLHIAYSDNGIGLSDSADAIKNYLLGIKYRLSGINGEIAIDKSKLKGFHISFSFTV